MRTANSVDEVSDHPTRKRGGNQQMQENRLQVLDGLRAASILLVLATHMLPLGPKALRLNETTGPMGMSLFFALSGFLIATKLVEGERVATFFTRRFARILPLAYAYLAAVLLVVTYNPQALVGNVLFVENYAHSYVTPLTSHFWSLCVELHFYIGIGLTVAVFGTRGLWLVIPACLAITAIRVTEGAYIDIKTHLRVDEILAGAIVALLYHHNWLRRCLPLYLLGILVIFWMMSSSPFGGPLQYARPYFSASILALSLTMHEGIIRTLLTCKPARYVAEISYALYVVHPLTFYGWMNVGSPFEKYLLKRPVSFAATFLLAHISTRYWESWWIALSRRATTIAAPKTRASL